MANKKNNVNKETAEIMENVKENENTMNIENVTAETVETIETTAPVEEQPATVEETAPALATVETAEEQPAPALDVENVRADILYNLQIANVRMLAYVKIDKKGKEINPTNWEKNETGKGNATLGGYVRELLATAENEIQQLKNQLKATYYNVSPAINKLLVDNNPTLLALAQNAVNRMSNVVLFKMSNPNPYQWQVEKFVQEYFNADIIKALHSAGIEEIGINEKLLGYAMPVLVANGYVMDINKPQPVTVEDIEIDGLDKIKGYQYFSFKRA